MLCFDVRVIYIFFKFVLNVSVSLAADAAVAAVCSNDSGAMNAFRIQEANKTKPGQKQIGS